MSRRQAVHGLDPVNLLEKILRDRIRESIYWKEQCFALTAESLIDRAVALEYVGGLFGGNQRASPFVCLLLKLLELQPEDMIIQSFLVQKEYKYLRLLAAFYWRMTASSKHVYLALEPLLQDYRKIRVRIGDGFMLGYADQIVDDLLREDRVFNIVLPRLSKRELLEKLESLPPYVSPLDVSDAESSSDEGT